MTIGIYILRFPGTKKVYVGQSIEIETRYTAHKYSLKVGTSSYKMQEAYALHGNPLLEIICECDIPELDAEEANAIEIFDSATNGYNTLITNTNRCSWEDNTAKRKYSEEVYINIFKLLVKGVNTTKQIAELFDVPFAVVKHIRNLNSHDWLKDMFPEDYALLKYRKLNYEIGSHSSSISTGKTLPDVLSPDGTLHTITNISAFCKDHNLQDSAMGLVLKGTSRQHKGWTLGSKPLPPSDYIKSPGGELYEIVYNGAAKFAQLHGLDGSSIRKLITGKMKSHKGWTLPKEE